jgi:hypothetical protein
MLKGDACQRPEYEGCTLLVDDVFVLLDPLSFISGFPPYHCCQERLSNFSIKRLAFLLSCTSFLASPGAMPIRLDLKTLRCTVFSNVETVQED